MPSLGMEFVKLTTLDWTVEQLKRVFWSGDHFSLWQSDVQVWVWRMPGECYLCNCIVPTMKFSGGGIMVWGRFSGFWLGSLYPVKCNLNGATYQDILDNAMLLTFWQQFGEVPFLFRNDWSPILGLSLA